MEFEGKIWKEKNHWLIEITSLDLITQGKTRKEALFMLKDAVYELIQYYFKKKSKIIINEYGKEIVGISTSDTKVLLALSLRRQREKENLTIRDIVHRLKFKSPNAYSQYERGQINLSLEQYEKMLTAINPSSHYLFRLA
ncbi:MAG: hypothetical protein KR126chlam6_01331 [Candidatus Anoxychlamydiales bacterium]|nr:hypothetical protein [Candidatus Anoxychlamydiales bacterium]